MDLENLSPRMQFVFIALMKSAIIFKEDYNDKKTFISFCEEMWNTIELNDLEDLKKTIYGKMESDIKPYVEKYIKNKSMSKN